MGWARERAKRPLLLKPTDLLLRGRLPMLQQHRSAKEQSGPLGLPADPRFSPGTASAFGAIAIPPLIFEGDRPSRPISVLWGAESISDQIPIDLLQARACHASLSLFRYAWDESLA